MRSCEQARLTSPKQYLGRFLSRLASDLEVTHMKHTDSPGKLPSISGEEGEHGKPETPWTDLTSAKAAIPGFLQLEW